MSSRTRLRYSAHMRSLFVLRLFAMLANAGSYVYLARFLGPFRFGAAAAAVGVVLVLQGVLDLGGSTLVTRDASESSPSENLGIALRYRWYLSHTWLYLSVVTLIVALASRSETSLLVVCGLWVLAGIYESLFVGLLLGLGRTSAAGYVGLIEKLTSLGLILGMPLFIDPGVTDFIAAFAAGAVVASAVGRALTRHECRLALSAAPSLSTTRLRRGMSFMAGNLGAQLQNLDVPLVAWLAGAASAGLLAAPSRLTSPLGLLASSAATIILVQRRHTQGRLKILPTALVVVALTSVGVSPLIVAPEAFARFLMGEGYEGAAGVFRLVALGVVLASLSQVLAADLLAHHKQRLVASAVIMGGILDLVVVVSTAPALGAVGGGLGVVSSQILILCLIFTHRRRMLRGGAGQ
jgi:O-antigen/teichoic acid export membrane protein